MNMQKPGQNSKKLIPPNLMGRNHLTGACLNQDDAIKREKYLKTYNGKRFLHKRLKSYLTG
jgi:hypothetical protein